MELSPILNGAQKFSQSSQQAPRSHRYPLRSPAFAPSVSSTSNPDQPACTPDIVDILKYYERDRASRKKVCPFSAPERANPCTTHATPRTRKDLIQRHLQTVLRHHGDQEHPLDDPLWRSSDLQQYWLAPRPDKLTNPEHKKYARRRTQAKAYQKRVAREMSDEGKQRKEQYERGEIPSDEYTVSQNPYGE